MCGAEEWQSAVRAGIYAGSADDRRDGFIHFSTADQLSGTLAKYFAGRSDLVLVRVGAVFLGDLLRWEPSRGGALFPHLYGPLQMAAVLKVEDLPLRDDGSHAVPELQS